MDQEDRDLFNRLAKENPDQVKGINKRTGTVIPTPPQKKYIPDPRLMRTEEELDRLAQKGRAWLDRTDPVAAELVAGCSAHENQRRTSALESIQKTNRMHWERMGIKDVSFIK